MEAGVSLQETLRGLWRRRKLVLIVFAVTFAVGVAVVGLLPDRYRATVVVRVDQQRPSTELVSPSVTYPIEDRLRIVRQELLARPVLERAIEELQLFPDSREDGGMEAAVGRLAAMLDVKVEGEQAFELSVVGADPEEAAKIANRLPALYAEEALRVRGEQAARTAQLFDEEVSELGRKVSEQEARIARFKIEHLGELPEQMEANMRGLERIMGLMTARTEARREMQRRAAELVQARTDADSELGRLQRRELDLNRDLIAGRSQWTDTHPEVQRLERELATVQSRREAAEARQKETAGERGYLRSQITALNTELGSLEKEALVYRARLDRTPQWGQELSVLGRDYELLRTKYQSLLSRKVEAEVARDLEAKHRAAMFHVLSPASAPRAPFKPDRAAGLALALLAALAAGVIAGVFRELQDDSLRRAEQARELSMPVLALVPKIPMAGRR